MKNIKNAVSGVITLTMSLVTVIGVVILGSSVIPNDVNTLSNPQPFIVMVSVIGLGMISLLVLVRVSNKIGGFVAEPDLWGVSGIEVGWLGSIIGVLLFTVFVAFQWLLPAVSVNGDYSLLSAGIVGIPLLIQSLKMYTPDMLLIDANKKSEEYEVEYIRDKTSKLDGPEPDYHSTNNTQNNKTNNPPSDEELASREPEDVTDGETHENGVDTLSLEYGWRNETDVCFSDIGGLKELKNELTRDVIKPLTTHKEKAKSLGVSAPNIVFHGPPGTGKTYMAKALATELGLPFANLSGADVQSKWINESADKVKQLFDEAEIVAEDAGGAVVFLDELDSVLKNRNSSGHEEDNKVVNEFLNHLEETGDNDIVFIGATNRIDSLDEAGIRSGRIDKKVHIGKPDFDARREIIMKQLQDRPHELSEEMIVNVVSQTEGCVAADLELVVKTAAKHVLGRDGDKICRKDMQKAINETSC